MFNVPVSYIWVLAFIRDLAIPKEILAKLLNSPEDYIRYLRHLLGQRGM